MSVRIVGIHEDVGLLNIGIDYFSKKWNSDKRLYADALANSFGVYSPLPRWYLMMADDEIIGCCGLIANDFISRQDLTPWACALYVEESHRHQGRGRALLEHVRREAGNLGFKKLYLCTDHQGYYEQYGWTHMAYGFHPWGESSRIYVHNTIIEAEPLQFMGNPVLETERLCLRTFRKEDAEDVFAYAQNPQVARFMTWDTHTSRDDSLNFIEWAQEQVQRDAGGQWAIELKESNRVIGSIGFSHFDPLNSCGAVGYALKEQYWSLGLTTEALVRLLEFVFKEMELNRVEAMHFLENPASGRVMEKAGMHCEGVLREKILAKGRYWDVKQYAVLRCDWLDLKRNVL